MSEGFKPVSNTPPVGVIGKLKFYGRTFLDFQFKTIYKDVKKVLPNMNGNVLDVGCGDSPYRFLLNESQIVYHGIDIEGAKHFDYNNPEITYFNGEDIPFSDEKFDALICTEVLEHVENYQKLINEMHRVLKPNGTAIITIPWSARYHYVPYDFYRYTPSSLKKMFGAFKEIAISPRGNDVSAIASKLVVLYVRNITSINAYKLLTLLMLVPFIPFVGLFIVFAHFALIINSKEGTEDPLGYTITLVK